MRKTSFYDALHGASTGKEQESIINRYVNQNKMRYLIIGMFIGIGVVMIALCI